MLYISGAVAEMYRSGGLTPSVAGDAGDGHHEVEIAAELVDASRVTRHERAVLLVGQVDVGECRIGVAQELGPVRGILLEAVEQTVDGVAAHASLHSTAVRLMRGSSPK